MRTEGSKFQHKPCFLVLGAAYEETPRSRRRFRVCVQPLLATIVMMTFTLATQAAAPWRLSSRGYGPVRVGMTLEEAQTRMGTRLKPSEDMPMDPSCDYVYSSRSDEKLSFMVQRGRIAHVSVASTTVQTISGVMVGESAARLKAMFGRRLEIRPHHYDAGAFYYFVWETDRHYGVKFEVSGGKVTMMHGGDGSIELVEGCA